jgi:uncharacterized protein (TIGR02186 family)
MRAGTEVAMRETLLTVTLTALICAAPPAAAAPTGSLRVAPNLVEVGASFNGSVLRVDGVVPRGYGAAVVLRGPDRDVRLKRKGKVWGVLWMNVGEVSFDHVPSAYLLATSGPICELAPAEARARLGVGLDVLTKFALTDPANAETRTLFGELVRLREGQGLYALREGALHIDGRPGDDTRFHGELRLPACIPEGSYEVGLVGFRAGEGLPLAAARVTVEEVGMIRILAGLARDHGLIFGLLAVAVALAMGLLTGVVFGLGGKRGH